MRDGGRASRKNFPEGPIPTIRVGAFYAYAFGGRAYRSAATVAAAAAATYVHPVYNARKVHVRRPRVYARSFGKRREKASPVAASYGDVRPMRRDESERSWESKVHVESRVSTCQKLEIRIPRLREIEILTAVFTDVD